VIPPLDAIPEQSRERLEAVLRDVTAMACRRMSDVKFSSLQTRKAEQEVSG
jgi:hypothetical protein